MAIPGIFPKNAPEGLYNTNQPIWLAGQNNGSENGAKFNAANLPFTGNGTNTTILPPYQLCLGNPNGTVVARGIGDFTLSNPGGWIYEATATGNMSWSNVGFSLLGPPGPAGNGIYNGGINEGFASDMLGLIAGNGTNLQGSSQFGIDFLVTDTGTFIVFQNVINGLLFPNNSTGQTFSITSDTLFFGIGDVGGGAVIGIQVTDPRRVFFLGNATICGEGNSFYPPPQASLVSSVQGQVAYDYVQDTITWRDLSGWKVPGSGNVTAVTRYKNNYDANTTYNFGDMIVGGPLSQLYIWAGNSTVTSPPGFDPGWISSFQNIGILSDYIDVVIPDPANSTIPNDLTVNDAFRLLGNITFGFEKRLKDINDIMNLSVNGDLSFLDQNMTAYDITFFKGFAFTTSGS